MEDVGRAIASATPLERLASADSPSFHRAATTHDRRPLRIANPPAYGLARRCETVDQAITMLGLKQVGAVVTGLVLRKVRRTDGPQLTRFWDVSAKRSRAMSQLARGLRGVDADIAQSFGLFCDVGIALLMHRFPDCGRTLKACNDDTERSFTEVEHALHHTDHALIGGIMRRSWGHFSNRLPCDPAAP